MRSLLLPVCWCLLSGWEAVRQSWEAIFKDSRELRFTLSDLQIQIEGGLAWVTGTENILSQSQGNISVTAVLVTNVYERRGTRWLMAQNTSYGMQPHRAAISSAVIRSLPWAPSRTTSSPTCAHARSVRSTMHMSMQTWPTKGTRCPWISTCPTFERLRCRPSAPTL